MEVRSYAGGREGDTLLVGLPPRAKEISLYLYPELREEKKLLQEFGKHRSGAGCLYIKKLQIINIEVLAKLITSSMKYLQQKYPS